MSLAYLCTLFHRVSKDKKILSSGYGCTSSPHAEEVFVDPDVRCRDPDERPLLGHPIQRALKGYSNSYPVLSVLA